MLMGWGALLRWLMTSPDRNCLHTGVRVGVFKEVGHEREEEGGEGGFTYMVVCFHY